MSRLPAPSSVLNDRYRLAEQLPTSAGYEVRRAFDLLLRRPVLARIHTYGPGEQQQRLRHTAVARLMASLSHHNIVPLLDFDSVETADGGGYLLEVVETARGESLRRRLVTRTPLTMRQAAGFAFDLAEALEHLHEHGVVHRGLTPSTVLLTEHDGLTLRTQIADLSTAVRTHAAEETPAAEVPGLWAYLSPEQLLGGCGSEAGDVYMLGLVVLEALTGRAAFTDPQERLARPGAAPVLPDPMPEALAGLLRQATAVDADARPSAAALAVGFQRFLAEEQGRNRRLDPALRSAEQEEARLAALQQYDLLDTPPEGAFDRITGLAARVLDMPVSTVSIVDRDRIWFKSHFGLDGGEIARDPGLCATVVRTGELVHIPDAALDDRARENPLIAGDLGLQSYAGVPLTSTDGFTLGALSVADYRPRALTAEQLDVLERLGRVITRELEMRLATRRALVRQG